MAKPRKGILFVNKHKPDIALIGATNLGRDLSGAIATVLKAGLTADCTGLDIDDQSKKLLSTRPTFGGNIMATIFCQKGKPQMSTVRPKVMKMPEPDPKRQGHVIKESVPVDPKDLTVKILEYIPDSCLESVEIEHAKILVAGGRGCHTGWPRERAQNCWWRTLWFKTACRSRRNNS